ncbi:MAG TPA: hypothetical protein VM097_10425 [Mycobacteriales bacterium]|nr:hypothetical protein [Mycobacteriales bacterium]
MSQRNTLAHVMHDAGLAAWFGGSLMGAVGVNGAAADVDLSQRARVANAGWDRWTPINAAAIAMHLIGGAQIMRANKGRVATQKGVLGNTMVKSGLTAGAMAATAYARYLGKKMSEAGDVPVAGATEPTSGTPVEVEKAQKQLKTLQWAIPGITGAMLASSSLHEEQQRPAQVVKGTLLKLPAAVGAAVSGAAATAKLG